MNTENETNPKTGRRLGAAPCSATANELIIAFVQGVRWWEWQKDEATLWPSDRDHAEAKAQYMASIGTLGKSPNDPDQRPPIQTHEND